VVGFVNNKFHFKKARTVPYFSRMPVNRFLPCRYTYCHHYRSDVMEQKLLVFLNKEEYFFLDLLPVQGVIRKFSSYISCALTKHCFT